MKFMDTSGAEDTPAPTEEKPVVRNVLDREGLAMANQALKEVGMDASSPLTKGISDAGLTRIEYTKEIHGKWQIDHGQRGDDFIVQMIPRKPISLAVGDVCNGIIATLFEIVPRKVEVFITPPNSRLQIDFYTVRLEGVMRRPGAEAMITSKVPAALGEINAWPQAT